MFIGSCCSLEGPHVGLWQELLRAKKEEIAVQAHWSVLLFSPMAVFMPTPISEEAGQAPFSTLKPKYDAYCHEQPISHFDSSVNGTFCQRYWIDASSYKPGGPVFCA